MKSKLVVFYKDLVGELKTFRFLYAFEKEKYIHETKNEIKLRGKIEALEKVLKDIEKIFEIEPEVY